MKKTLNWRLKDLPDAVDVAELVDKKVITPEEARQLLFNEGDDKTKKVKELEEEVKFLRELCDKLASKSNGWTTIVREYERYKPIYPNWYSGYGTVINTINQPAFGRTVATGSTLTAGTMSVANQVISGSVSNNSTQALSKLN